MSTRIALHLNSGEVEHLNRAVPDTVSEQNYLRALLRLADEGESVRRRARDWAKEGRKIAPHPDDAPGYQKDLESEDYREAIAETGSLQSAAEQLGVHRSTVRYMAVEYEIEVPSMGGVPD
jgi:hypothetical protein